MFRENLTDMKNTILRLCVMCCGVLLTASFACSAPVADLEKIIIRLPWLHQSQYAGVYVAQAKGFFAQRGLKNVEILQGGPNIRPIDLIASGTEQFSITGSTPFLNAYREKRPLKIVATLDQTHAFCYFARRDRGINAPKDFHGQRVGHKIMHEHNLFALLASAGLGKEDVTLVPAPPQMTLFFLDDTNEGVPIWPGHAADEPLIAEERGIAVNYFFPETYDGIPRIGNLLFTSQDFERAHPDVVAQVVGAILAGWQAAFADVEAAVDVTMQYRGSTDANDRVHQRNMLLKMQAFMVTPPIGKKIGWCDPNRWQAVLDFFLKQHPDVAFTLSDILTNQYVTAFYQ